MVYQWIKPSEIDSKNASVLSAQLKIHPVIAKVLFSRQIDTAEKVEKYFNPDLENLYDPFLLDGMSTAVKRIIKALRDGEQIVIYGDYDVDGVTSVSILYDGLFRMGGKVSFFIPNRFKEGYGVSLQGIKNIIHRKVSLIITVDCGITAVEEIMPKTKGST